MADIEQVIANSIEGLDSGDSDSGDFGDTGGDTSVENTPELSASEEGGEAVAEETESPIAEAPALAEVEDALAKELGINPKNKNNRIPYHRVQAIIKKAEEKHAAQLAEREAKLNSFQRYESPEFQTALRGWEMLEKNPEQFLGALAQADPRYAQLLRREEQAAKPQAQPQVDEGEIQPDVLLPDGSLGYSPQAVQRMAAQQARQVAMQVKQELEQAYGPMRNAYETHQQAQALRGQVEQKVASRLREAQTWPGFKEHEAEMAEAVAKDPSITTVEQAYFKVVAPKLAANRDSIRKEVLAELNRKRHAAQGSVAPTSRTPAASGPRDTEDIIRDAIAGLEK